MAASLGIEEDQKTAWGAVFPAKPDEVGASFDLAVQPFDEVDNRYEDPGADVRP